MKEKKIEELERQLKYLEEKQKVCGYCSEDLQEMQEIINKIEELENEDNEFEYDSIKLGKEVYLSDTWDTIENQ